MGQEQTVPQVTSISESDEYRDHMIRVETYAGTSMPFRAQIRCKGQVRYEPNVIQSRTQKGLLVEAKALIDSILAASVTD
jgi:hypothetical protein